MSQQYIFDLIVDNFSPQSRKEKHAEIKESQSKVWNSVMNDPEKGFHMAEANHLLGYIYCGYPAFLSLILACIALRMDYSMNFMVEIMIIAFPIILAYIPIYHAVFYKNRHKSYYQLFINESDEWYRKWKYRTLFFVLGSLLASASGIIIGLAILIKIP